MTQLYGVYRRHTLGSAVQTSNHKKAGMAVPASGKIHFKIENVTGEAIGPLDRHDLATRVPAEQQSAGMKGRTTHRTGVPAQTWSGASAATWRAGPSPHLHPATQHRSSRLLHLPRPITQPPASSGAHPDPGTCRPR